MKKNIEEYIAFMNGEIRMPSHLKPRKEEKGRMYENKFMEKISSTPIYIPQSMWVIMILVFIWLSFTNTSMGFIEIVILMFSGAFVWTFLEYMIHRYVYHAETESERFQNVQIKMHLFHHHYPKDPDRLAMPPVPGLILASVFFGIFYLILGEKAIAFFPGFIFGYLLYITLHYFQHRWKSPKYKPWQKLWAHHKAHHYSNPYSAFGVSTRLWDWIFGTMPKKSNLKRKAQKVSIDEPV